MTIYLSLEDLLTLAGDLGVGPVRDLGLLDGAAHRPQVELYGEQAYPDLDTKAAVLLESLVRSHALVDGNKRLGWLATVVFYGLNNLTLDAPDDDAFELVMAVARSEPRSRTSPLRSAPGIEPLLRGVRSYAGDVGGQECRRWLHRVMYVPSARVEYERRAARPKAPPMPESRYEGGGTSVATRRRR